MKTDHGSVRGERSSRIPGRPRGRPETYALIASLAALSIVALSVLGGRLEHLVGRREPAVSPVSSSGSPGAFGSEAASTDVMLSLPTDSAGPEGAKDDTRGSVLSESVEMPEGVSEVEEFEEKYAGYSFGELVQAADNTKRVAERLQELAYKESVRSGNVSVEHSDGPIVWTNKGAESTPLIFSGEFSGDGSGGTTAEFVRFGPQSEVARAWREAQWLERRLSER